jgi:predicted ester cyclase
MRVMPDGCVDVFVTDQGDVMIAGPASTFYDLAAGNQKVLAGFRLRTGVAAAVIGCPASEFANMHVSVDAERQERGPAGFLATSRWLRDAFSNLRFELQETLAEGDTVMAAAVMTGQHTGSFNGIAPTGRSIVHKQVHIFRFTNDRITGHRAVRDDLGLLFQLGWRPGDR